VIFAMNLRNVHLRRRQFQAHVHHCVGYDFRDSQVPEPLVIGRDHVPGCVLGARPFDGVLEGLDVVRPQFALRVVRFADFPVPLRIIEPLFEALELFLWANVEIELENPGAALLERLLEAID
jgi:hypothetical protein